MGWVLLNYPILIIARDTDNLKMCGLLGDVFGRRYIHHLFCFFSQYLIIINNAFLAPETENKVLWVLGILVAWYGEKDVGDEATPVWN